MINIPPIPKFADNNWLIILKNFPETWSLIIHHAVIWTLAQERRYRDCQLTLELINLSSESMHKLCQQAPQDNLDTNLSNSSPQFYLDPTQKFPEILRYADNNLGRIYCCSDSIYHYIDNNHLDKFAYLVKFSMDIVLKLQKKKPSRFYKQMIMSKFGLMY